MEAHEQIQAPPEMVRRAFEDGGRAVATVRSKKTGQHITIVLTARKRKQGGGYVSRGTIAGRVGIQDADVLEARDPDLEYPDNYIGRVYLDSGEWKPGRDADPSRAWTAQKVIAYGLGRFDLAAVADVFLASQCSYCGRPLTDPESIERGIGPECFGRHTKSRLAERQQPLPGTDPGVEAERRMQEAEARGDREQTRREERAKHEARRRMESGPILDLARAVVAEYPPCMGCGRPDDHNGECQR
jgi:hypothetical protein